MIYLMQFAQRNNINLINKPDVFNIKSKQADKLQFADLSLYLKFELRIRWFHFDVYFDLKFPIL